jgi:hypothetical protein
MLFRKDDERFMQRTLVSPDAIPARARKMLEQSVTTLKKGIASAPIDLTPFLKG